MRIRKQDENRHELFIQTFRRVYAFCTTNEFRQTETDIQSLIDNSFQVVGSIQTLEHEIIISTV